MTTSPADDSSLFVRYRVHFGLGVLLAVALSIMIFEVGVAEGPTAPEKANQQGTPPPIPTTDVEVVENELIQQSEIEYDTSLRMSAATTSHP